jgi:hypothetical protein
VSELLRGPPGGCCGIQKDRGGGLSGRISFPCVGGSIHQKLGVSVKKGLQNGASLSLGALLGEPGVGAPFLGALKVMKKGSVDGHLSSWGLSWATWSEHFYWGLCDMVERGSRGRASHSVGAP